jgi:hypothetical protein
MSTLFVDNRYVRHLHKPRSLELVNHSSENRPAVDRTDFRTANILVQALAQLDHLVGAKLEEVGWGVLLN